LLWKPKTLALLEPEVLMLRIKIVPLHESMILMGIPMVITTVVIAAVVVATSLVVIVSS
jgi:hypothetical protein